MKHVASADHDVIKMCAVLRNKMHVPKAWPWVRPGDMFRMIAEVGEMIEETNFNWRYFGNPYHDMGWHLTCKKIPTRAEIKSSKRTREQLYRDTVAISNLEPEFYRQGAAIQWLKTQTQKETIS